MSMRRLGVAAALCAVVGFGVMMCTESDGTSVTGPGGTPSEVVTYTVQGTMLIACWPESVYVYRYCEGTVMITMSDTAEADCDTILHEVNGNTLRLLVDSETMPGGAVVNYYENYTRDGSGTGLQGTWNLTSYSYAVATGTLSAAEQAAIEEDIDEGNQFLADGWGMTIVVDATTISFYETMAVADYIMETFGQYVDTSMFNVTLSKVDNNTVRITGNTSGEVVTIRADNSGNIVWTSSNPQHASHTYYANPTSCPNEYEPDWIEAFFLANLRLIGKSVSIDLQAPARPASMTRMGPAR